MKFARVKEERMEAAKGLIGTCQGCGQTMIPVCGMKRAWHWRHKVDCECDHWWENETEWHRTWKNQFPKECQEIRHKDAANGEWHIADVKTKQDHILEFQHSYLKPDERQARNNFYGEKLVWVVDGLARKNDLVKAESIINRAKRILPDVHLYQLSMVKNESALLSDWSDCKVPVFFDFGKDKPLCCLLPKSSKGNHFIVPVSRQDFIALHSGGLVSNKTFSDLIIFLTMRIFTFENPNWLAKLHKQEAPTGAQVVKQPVVQQRRKVMPLISMRDLNYLLRSHRPTRRVRRRF